MFIVVLEELVMGWDFSISILSDGGAGLLYGVLGSNLEIKQSLHLVLQALLPWKK